MDALPNYLMLKHTEISREFLSELYEREKQIVKAINISQITGASGYMQKKIC